MASTLSSQKVQGLISMKTQGYLSGVCVGLLPERWFLTSVDRWHGLVKKNFKTYLNKLIFVALYYLPMTASVCC